MFINRKIIKDLFQLLLLFSFILLLSENAVAGQYRVTRVYDGDTITCVGNGITIKVRLVGIDAPETSKKKNSPGQAYSQQSKKALAGLVLNKTIEVKGYGLDKYNRVLGEIFIDGKNVNLEMIKRGMAESYKGKPASGFNAESYLEAEKEAKSALKGMWSLKEKYISPKEWRTMQKEN